MIVPLLFVQLLLAETNVKPAGRISWTVKFVAVVVPEFQTVIAKVACCQTTTFGVEVVLVKLRSMVQTDVIDT